MGDMGKAFMRKFSVLLRQRTEKNACTKAEASRPVAASAARIMAGRNLTFGGAEEFCRAGDWRRLIVRDGKIHPDQHPLKIHHNGAK